MDQRVTNTLTYLRTCQSFRRQGGQVAFTTDPTWLVNMAINRRAGWPDDPSLLRGSACPVAGRYPLKASGDGWNHLRLLADRLNTPRLIVRECELGEWRKLILSRIPDRITKRGDELW